MLSIEEIKLLIEKLQKVKKEDLQALIDSNLKILKDIELAVDANNKEVIDRLDKTPEWFRRDIEQKKLKPFVDPVTARMVQSKIFQFARTNLYNSLEIGPGNVLANLIKRINKEVVTISVSSVQDLEKIKLIDLD